MGYRHRTFFSAFGDILPVKSITDLTQIAFDSFSTNVDKRSSKLYVAAVEALSVLAESLYLAPTLFSKQVFNAVLSRLPPEKNMHVAYSYLACLLLVHDQSINWWLHIVRQEKVWLSAFSLAISLTWISPTVTQLFCLCSRLLEAGSFVW